MSEGIAATVMAPFKLSLRHAWQIAAIAFAVIVFDKLVERKGGTAVSDMLLDIPFPRTAAASSGGA